MKLLQLQHNLSKIYNYRNFCIKSNKVLVSKQIRKLFLDFFIEQHKHKFIRSSPVIPFCDPTLAFVNAGMNQFKPIFLGKVIPTHKRVTNSQKCIRVGGKHNDLSIVGKDGYHHTFFEMLGNWSFGDYFKKEACKMALEFLKDSLKIDTSRLYVTYFGGDEKLNIPADLECYEIWKTLGFKDDRILAFGSNENFWEMGLTGPCGPCTEIHIDHLSFECNENRSKYVNAGRDDLTELWNLVFIQYNRNADGSIVPLPQHHVDTGMGMERLTAIIQGKKSNYDTDLFLPIIEKISKSCGTPEYKGIFNENDENFQLDTSYRIVADNSRMITACLSDGMLPDQNQKLRRIIRTVISLSENTFKNKNLLNETIPIVVEILGSTYPEMENKYENILDILNYEKELFKQLRLDASKDIQKEILIKYPKLNNEFDIIDYPGFINAFKEFQQIKKTFHNNVIPGKFLFKLHDTYGLNNDIIEKIAEIENFQLDYDGLKMELSNAKQKFKLSLYSNDNQNHVSSIIECATKLLSTNATKTNDNFKYNYEFNKNHDIYNVPKLEAKILAIFEKDQNTNIINSNSKNIIGIVTDKSNFYYESGGQESDQSIIRINDHSGNVIEIEINHVEKINDCIIHIGKFIPNNLNYEIKINDNVNLHVNDIHRTYNILHHTGTHLLNASVRNLFKKVVYQISSSVTSKQLKFELGIIGKKLLLDDLISIEKLIRNIISSALPIEIRTINALEMLEMTDIITVPGEIYPEFDLRLVQIKNNDKRNSFISKELCCGTHAKNTSELNEFCIINFKQISRIKYAFTAVCGNLAKETLTKSTEYLNKINNLEQKFRNDPEHFDIIEKDLKKLKNELLHDNDNKLSYILKMECLDKINDLSKVVKEVSRSNLKNFVEIEMTNILQQCPKEKHPFIIHFLKSSSLMQAVPLQKATKVCSDRPILVISLDDGKIKARCCVPKDKISDKFSAIRWLQEFSDVFKGQISPPKGQNPNEVCNMKAKKVLSSLFHDQLDLAIKRAREYAIKNL